MGIGNNIKKIRKLQNISRKELSEDSGISIVTLGRYEREERTPSLETLNHLASALWVPIQILINWTDYLNEHPDVMEFLEEILDFYDGTGLICYDRIALALNINPDNKDYSLFINNRDTDMDNIKHLTFYKKISDFLDLTDEQLYNWIFNDAVRKSILNNKDEKYLSDLNNLGDKVFYLQSVKKVFEKQDIQDLILNGLSENNEHQLYLALNKKYNSKLESLDANTNSLYVEDKKIIIDLENFPEKALNELNEFIDYLKHKYNVNYDKNI